MAAKKTTVILEANGISQEFEFSHAERLLKMPKNGGWKLPDNSPFEFVENALGRKPNKKRDSGK